MIREFYRGLNFLVMVILALFISAAQAVVLKLNLISWLSLDLVLLMVIYLALHRQLLEGILLILLVARIAEIHSASPAGILTLGYLGVFISIWFVKRMLLVGTSFSSILLAMAGGLLWKIYFLMLAIHQGLFSNVWRNTLELLIPFLLGMALFSRPIFAFFKKVDTITNISQESEAEQLSGEDFLMLGQNEQLQSYQDRFRYLYVILAGMAVILVMRLWYLQILRGEEFKQFAEENRLKKIKIEAPRGMVFDRNHKLLTDNQPTLSVQITPQYFRSVKQDKRDETVAKLSKIIRLPETTIKEALFKARRQPSFQPVVIKRNLSMNEVSMIEMEKLDMPGVEVTVGIQRTNVNGTIGAQLLGYIAEVDADEITRVNKNNKNPYMQGDFIGKSGIEQQMENYLRGENGIDYFEVDAFGRKKTNIRRTKENVVPDIKPKPVVPGKNLVLTIDEDLQIAAAEAFGKDKTGAVVALDPTNGEVLSMLSWPSFSNTEFSVGISPEYWKELANNEDKPLRDKTIIDHYSPGSTFKIISALAGLEEGLINAQTIVVGGGSFWFGGRAFHDWKKEGHGPTDVVKSLYRSVDVFFYKLGTRMEIDTLSNYARALGLGAKTGIKMPGEIAGIVPSTEWKRRTMNTEWFPGETLSVIIGQGSLTATPIQLANMIATIANGGTLYRPRIVKTVENVDGTIIETTKPEVIRTTNFKPENLALVRKGIEEVVANEQGTAHAQFTPGIRMAGKTGTAQVIRFSADKVYANCHALPRRYRHHGLFVAYAPVEDPKIAVAVVAEHACSGSGGAAPIATALIRKYLAKIDPSKYGPEALKQARADYFKQKKSPLGGGVGGD
jgi:penicillin-binding protein 2